MRILDKNTDFYDYLQGIYRDTSVTFDRTDSFIVTKDLMCNYLQYGRYVRDRNDPYRYVLLQVCNTFWLFLLKITEFSGSWDEPKNYDVKLLHTWKNYDKKRCLIKLDIILLKWSWIIRNSMTDQELFDTDVSDSKAQKTIDKIVQNVDSGEFDIQKSIDSHRIYYGSYTYKDKLRTQASEKHIPLLIACGLGNCMDPLDMYLSIEEYFSLEKQSTERSESIGLTDIEKVENHGFDKKSSFRGK